MKIKALKEFNLRMTPGDEIEVTKDRYEKIKKVDKTLIEVVDEKSEDTTAQQPDEKSQNTRTRVSSAKKSSTK